jgi:hypothetical protein
MIEIKCCDALVKDLTLKIEGKVQIYTFAPRKLSLGSLPMQLTFFFRFVFSLKWSRLGS